MNNHASEWDLKDLLKSAASRLGGLDRSSKISSFLLPQMRSHVIVANREKDAPTDGQKPRRHTGLRMDLTHSNADFGGMEDRLMGILVFLHTIMAKGHSNKTWTTDS